MKAISQKLFYCATRLALLAAGLAPFAFWGMLLMSDIARSHGHRPDHDYAIWGMPTLMTAVPLSAVLGIWLKSRRASAEDLAFLNQIEFFLWSAAVWLCGAAPLLLGFRLGHEADGFAFPLSLLILGASVFRQGNDRGFLFFMWLSGMSVLMLSGMPTC
jgi:hypothetical protein